MPAFEDDDLFHDESSYRASSRGEGRKRDDSWDVEDEGPDDRDLVPDEFTTVRCTECRKLIFEDSPFCPYCKCAQIEAHRPRHPRWLIFTALVALFLTISGLLGGVLIFFNFFHR